MEMSNKNKSDPVQDICIVPHCQSANSPGLGIRFHSFPHNTAKRKTWLKNVKLPSKTCLRGAMICSLHFTPDNYYKNNPKNKLKPNAVPQLKMVTRKLESNEKSTDTRNALKEPEDVSSDDSEEEMVLPSRNVKKKAVEARQKTVTTKSKKEADETNEESYGDPEMTDIENVLTNTCRICLTTNCKMYSMKQYNLEETYILLMGVNVTFDASKLPQMLCFECVRRFQNYLEFSTKCLKSWSFLVRLIQDNKLTMASIMERNQNVPTSTLSVKHFAPDFYNLLIKECDSSENKNVDKPNDNIESVLDEQDLDSDKEDQYDTMNENDAAVNDKDDKEDQYDTMNENDAAVNDKDDNESKRYVNSDDPNCKRKKKYTKKYVKEFNELFIVRTMTAEDQREEIENRKNSSRYQNAVFKCDKCYRDFRFEGPFKEHMKRHSKEFGEFECQVCQTHFETRVTLGKHITSRHDKFFECRRCSFKSAWKSAAYKHKEFHDGKRFQCKKCPKSFAKASSHTNHVQRWHPQEAMCHLCGDSFRGIYSLEQHLRGTHKDEDWLMPPSKLEKRIESQFVRRLENPATNFELVNVITALPSDAPYCGLCDMRFKDSQAFEHHKSVSYNHGKPFKLKNPYKTLKKGAPTKDKKKSDPKPANPINCEQCAEVCPSFRQYVAHFTVAHAGLNRTQYPRGRFMCEVCGKVFQHMAFLKDHRGTHGDARPHACDQCAAMFKTKQALCLHRANHRSSLECELCGKTFASVSGLNRHSLIHTGKPYSCAPCNKRFITPAAKRAHVRHAHAGVPWPKKRKGKSTDNSVYHSAVDMDVETKSADSSILT